MMKKKKESTAEWWAKLQADPEFIAQKKERDRVFAERAAKFSAEQAPLLAELRSAGLNIQDVSDLINTSDRYESAIPILLKHLLLPYSDVTRETIARSLAVPDARYAWPIFVAEFKKVTVNEKRLKDGLAVALAATVTEDVLDDLIAIAKDSSHGDSRLLLLRALKKSKGDKGKQALRDLLSDPVLGKEIKRQKML